MTDKEEMGPQENDQVESIETTRNRLRMAKVFEKADTKSPSIFQVLHVELPTLIAKSMSVGGSPRLRRLAAAKKRS